MAKVDLSEVRELLVKALELVDQEIKTGVPTTAESVDFGEDKATDAPPSTEATPPPADESSAPPTE